MKAGLAYYHERSRVGRSIARTAEFIGAILDPVQDRLAPNQPVIQWQRGDRKSTKLWADTNNGLCGEATVSRVRGYL